MFQGKVGKEGMMQQDLSRRWMNRSFIVLLLLLAFVPAWSAQPSGEQDRYLFLEVWTYTGVLRGGGVHPDFPTYSYDPTTKVLTDFSAGAPESFVVAVGRGLSLHGGNDGAASGLTYLQSLPSVVDDETTIQLLEVKADGTAILTMKGEKIELQAGQERLLSPFQGELSEERSELFFPYPGGVVTQGLFRVKPDFEAMSFTVLRNFGFWEKANFQTR